MMRELLLLLDLRFMRAVPVLTPCAALMSAVVAKL